MSSNVQWGAADVKRFNMARCALFLRDHGAGTVADVAAGTGLSRPTVEGAFAALMERGLVAETAEPEGARIAGRPARRFRFRGESGYVAGVDVGAHGVRVVLSRLDGRAGTVRDVVASSEMDGPARLRLVISEIDAALGEVAADRSLLVSIGVAVTGFVDGRGAILLSHNLPGWEGTAIAERIAKEFDCLVSIDNDARLATLAEHRIGAAQLATDVVYFAAGHRVSMGLVIGGETRRGRHGAAGEIGDLAFRSRSASGGELLWTSAATGEEVFRLAADGDEGARREVDEFIRSLATGIAAIALAIDPDVIVIGGGMSHAGDQLIGPLRDAIREAVRIPIELTVLASALGAEAVVMGALIHAMGVASTLLFGVEGLPEPRVRQDLSRAEGGSSGLPGQRRTR